MIGRFCGVAAGANFGSRILRDLIPHVLQMQPRGAIGGLGNRGAHAGVERPQLAARQRTRLAGDRC